MNEETARAGGYDFTLDQLKALTFKRNNTSIDITSAFLMSGAVQDGNLVNITTAGTIASGDNAIRLSRIVSKVKFTIKAAKEKLMESAQKLFAKLYESQQAAGGAAGAGPDMGAGASNGSAPYGDDVVDGDYKEV